MYTRFDHPFRYLFSLVTLLNHTHTHTHPIVDAVFVLYSIFTLHFFLFLFLGVTLKKGTEQKRHIGATKRHICGIRIVSVIVPKRGEEKAKKLCYEAKGN